MQFLRFDYWAPAATNLSMYLISPGPRETPFVVNVQDQSWQSVSIPLSTFTDVDLSDTFQLKVTGNGNIFLDNIMFTGSVAPSNMAPEVTLLATQNSAQVTAIEASDGTVSINATVTDSNAQDTHTLVWTVTGVTNFTTNDTQISFDPSGLNVAQISINVEVSDSASPSLSNTANLILALNQPVVLLVPIETESARGGGTMSQYLLLGLMLAALRRRNVW